MNHPLRTRALLAAVMLASSLPVAHAATLTWTGTASTDWSNTGNWAEGVAPADGDDLVFTSGNPPNQPLSNTLSGLDLRSITFANGSFTAPLTLAGNAFALDSTYGATTTLTNGNSTAGRTVTISNAVAVVGSQTWAAPSANGVTILMGNLSGSGNLSINTSDGRTAVAPLRLGGTNSGYSGNVAWTTGVSGLMLLSPGAMIGGNIAAANTDQNVWLQGGAGLGTYGFGIGPGTGAVGFRNAGSGGLHLNDNAAWDPGVGANYSLVGNTNPRVRMGQQLSTHTVPWVIDFGNSSSKLVVGANGFTVSSGSQSSTAMTPIFRMLSALSDDGSARPFSAGEGGNNAVNQLVILTRPASSGNLGGTTTITSSTTLAINGIDRLFSGSLSLASGALLFDGVPWSDFAARYPNGFASSAVAAGGTFDQQTGATTLTPGTYTYRVAHVTSVGMNVFGGSCTFSSGARPRVRNFASDGTLVSRIWRRNLDLTWDLVFEGPAVAATTFEDAGGTLQANVTPPDTTTGNPASIATGAWYLGNGTIAGFAARGTPLTITANGTDAMAPYYFNRDFRLGSICKMGTSFYADASVRIEQPTTLTGRRAYYLCNTAPGFTGTSGIVHEYAGALSGSGALVVMGLANGGSASEGAELLLSGSNTWTGSPYTGFNLGRGGLAIGPNGNNDGNNAFVRFVGNASLPTGNAGQPAYIAALNRNGTEGNFGILLTGSPTGEVYAPATGYKFLVGAVGNDGGGRAGCFGSTGGKALLQGADLVVFGGVGSAVATARNLYLLVRDGVLTLGTPGGGNAVRFQPGYVAATATDGGLTAAATALSNASATRTLIKRGPGTLVLGNVTYTQIDGTGDTTAQHTWQLGRGGTGTDTLVTPIYDGAIRSVLGGDSSNSLANRSIRFNGAVIELDASALPGTAAAWNPALGTAAGQVSFDGNDENAEPLGGGFAAFSTGTVSRVIVGVTGYDTVLSGWDAIKVGSQKNFFSVNDTGKSPSRDPLMLGSRTANAVIELTNNLELSHRMGQIRAIDNPASIADRAVVSGRLQTLAEASKTGGLTLTGDGLIEFSCPTNTHRGTFNILGARVLLTGNIAKNTSTLPAVTCSSGAFGGTGVVERDVTIQAGGTMLAMPPGSTPLEIKGATLTISGQVAIDRDQTLAGGRWPVARATNGGVINYAAATVPEYEGNILGSLSMDGDTLYLGFSAPATVVIVR